MANYDEILRTYCEYIANIFISIGIAIGIVWKSTLRPGIPLGPSFTTGKNPIMLRMFGELNTVNKKKKVGTVEQIFVENIVKMM